MLSTVNGNTTSPAFNIADHLENLTPDGGSCTQYEKSFFCPVCGAKNFKVNLRPDPAKYDTFSCECNKTATGKREVIEAIDSSACKKSNRPQQKRYWVYKDFKGKPAIKVHRTDDGNGGRKIWQESLVPNEEPKNLKVAPYRHKECLAELKKGSKHIYWVEGEACCDALWKLGLPATTTLGGSNGYESATYRELFPADRLVICPDRDEVGRKYAEAIASDYPNAQWLYANPESYFWKRRQWSGGFDVADWIGSGATAEDILAAVCEKRYLRCEGTSKGGMALDDIIERLRQINGCEDSAQQWQLMQELMRDSGKTKRDLMDLDIRTRVRSSDIKVYTAKQFGERDLGAKEWLIEGIIPANRVTLLGADSKTGKSLLLYDWAYHIATGQDWLNFTNPQRRKVLIVQADEGEIDCQERINTRGLNELDNVLVINKFTPSLMPWLKRKVNEWGIEAIFFDSLTSIQRHSGHGLKDPEYGYWLYDLTEFASDNQITCVVTAHTNKASIELGLDKVAGSYSITAAVSEILMLTRPADKLNPSDTERVLVRVGSRSNGSDAWHLDLNLEDFSWEDGTHCNRDGVPLDEDYDVDKSASLREKVRGYLQHLSGQFVVPNEISSIVGGTPRRALLNLGMNQAGMGTSPNLR